MPGPLRAGYTMLEVVVVVAIVAVALTVSTPALIRMIEQQRVQSVLRGIDIGLTDLRAASQIDARVIDAGEAEAALAADLPVGWYILVDEAVTFSPAGVCNGGRLQVTTPRGREYVFSLARRTCSLDQRIA
ncbi:prepilin-type N-terminal cleavage/methylation domain-containing protein [Maricaulis sp.]|uniref:prepilin-type N-terminal cleavage/methylation domain-containing protein n=1 Tax=Maricaulis sp. TaxID=1486257 RepID=UPI0032970878